MPSFDSQHPRRSSRHARRRRKRAAFWYALTGIFIIASVTGLMYLAYVQQQLR